MNKKLLTKALANAFEAGQKSGLKLTAKYVCVWFILALREEGFGSTRLSRVLERVFHYIDRFKAGDLDMNQMRDHVFRTTDIYFDYSNDDSDFVYEEDLENEID